MVNLEVLLITRPSLCTNVCMYKRMKEKCVQTLKEQKKTPLYYILLFCIIIVFYIKKSIGNDLFIW